MKEGKAEGMPCLEAEPESWQTGGGFFIGGTTSVSSDFRGAKPRPHPSDKAALARGKNGRRRSIALQVIDRRSRAAFVIYWRDDLRVVRLSRGEAPPPSVRQGRAGAREKWAPTEHRPPGYR